MFYKLFPKENNTLLEAPPLVFPISERLSARGTVYNVRFYSDKTNQINNKVFTDYWDIDENLKVFVQQKPISSRKKIVVNINLKD